MITITSEEHNTLLNRKELLLDITFTDKTPTKVEMKKQLAEKQKTDEKLVVIKNIYGLYGERRAKVEAYIYDNEKALKDIEPKLKKKKEKKEEAPAPAKQEAKSAAKPAEAPKAEPKKEEKPKQEPKEEKKNE